MLICKESFFCQGKSYYGHPRRSGDSGGMAAVCRCLVAWGSPAASRPGYPLKPPGLHPSHSTRDTGMQPCQLCVTWQAICKEFTNIIVIRCILLNHNSNHGSFMRVTIICWTEIFRRNNIPRVHLICQTSAYTA